MAVSTSVCIVCISPWFCDLARRHRFRRRSIRHVVASTRIPTMKRKNQAQARYDCFTFRPFALADRRVEARVQKVDVGRKSGCGPFVLLKNRKPSTLSRSTTLRKASDPVDMVLVRLATSRRPSQPFRLGRFCLLRRPSHV